MFAWWGRTVYRYRYIVIGVMVALCLGGGIYGISLGNHVTQSGFYDEGSQSVHASVIGDEVYGRDRTSHVVAILTPPDGEKVDNPEWQREVVGELDSFVSDHPDQVVSWVGWLRAPDAASETVQQMKTSDLSKTFISIPLKGDTDDEILKNYQAVEPALLEINGGDIQLAGLNPLASELTGSIGEDQRRAEVAAIPLVCVVLFFVFGGVVAAALPGIIGGLTIAGALGIMRLLAEFMPVHFFAQPVVTLMGLGIAVDYGLFMVSRFREEIAEGYDTEAAVRRTVMTSGRTIMFSAVILVASSVPLLLFPQGFLKSITYAIIASVMLAAILSITVLAAALGILGANVDALGVRTLLRVPFFRNWKPMRVYLEWLAEKTQKTKTRAEVEKGFWGKLVNRVMKRPVAFAAPIVIVMIALIIPLGGLSLGGISEKYLPPDNSVRLAQEEFDRVFPGFRTEPLTIVMEREDGEPITDQQIAEMRTKAMTVSGFIEPEDDPSKMWQERSVQEGGSKDPSVRVIQNGLENRNDASKKINELRELTPPRGVNVSVGGTPALEQDSIHSLFDKLPLMVTLLIVTTTVLMFLAFGSVVLPIKAAVMSALTLGSTMGVLTWMFVDGHGSGLMNYTPQPLMAPMIGLIIAVIWGLSTDYEVFLVSRMVEARERGMSTAEAIRIGTATTGRLITGAALVLAVVAGAFVFSDLVMMKYLAFGLLLALLLDATVIRMFLVPAVMKLLGDDCWWAPRWMKRIQERLGLGETELPDERRRPVVRDEAENPEALVGAGAPVPPRPFDRPRPPHDPTHPAPAEGAARPGAPRVA
ncbi:trehalose monomycolate exporter MmpL3, partial [Mycolicibacterium flavescens]